MHGFLPSCKTELSLCVDIFSLKGNACRKYTYWSHSIAFAFWRRRSTCRSRMMWDWGLFGPGQLPSSQVGISGWFGLVVGVARCYTVVEEKPGLAVWNPFWANSRLFFFIWQISFIYSECRFLRPVDWSFCFAGDESKPFFIRIENAFFPTEAIEGKDKQAIWQDKDM